MPGSIGFPCSDQLQRFSLSKRMHASEEQKPRDLKHVKWIVPYKNIIPWLRPHGLCLLDPVHEAVRLKRSPFLDFRLSVPSFFLPCSNAE